MIAKPTRIPDVILFQPRVFEDDRGFFMETYHARRYEQHGLTQPFVQDNHSGSVQGVLRGLHYQIRHAQGKLVQVIAGEGARLPSGNGWGRGSLPRTGPSYGCRPDLRTASMCSATGRKLSIRSPISMPRNGIERCGGMTRRWGLNGP